MTDDEKPQKRPDDGSPHEPEREPRHAPGDENLGKRLATHLPDLERYVKQQLGEQLRLKESVGDVVQSVCRDVLAEDGFEYRGEAAFRSFLRRCARNKIYQKSEYHGAGKRDHRREVAAEPDRGDPLLEFAVTSKTPSRALVQADRIAEVRAAIDKLPAAYRDAVRMHRLEGLTSAEIADRLGRTPGAVRNLVYRGLALLAAALCD